MVAMDYNLKKWSVLQTTITLVSRNDNEYYGGGGGGGGGGGHRWMIALITTRSFCGL